MSDKNKCTNGHLWTPQSTYYWKGNAKQMASKRCKTCRAESAKRGRVLDAMRPVFR